MRKYGFTLVEIMVSIVVFAIVMVAVGETFFSVRQTWQRQKQTLDLVQNIRWAMDFMSNEIRQGGNVVVGSESWGGESVNRIQFELPPGGPANRVRYWRGNGLSFGNTTTLYRKTGPGLGPPSLTQELANFIVDNPSGNNIFIGGGGSLYRFELTVRPKPTQPEGPGNRSYTLRNYVRPRN